MSMLDVTFIEQLKLFFLRDTWGAKMSRRRTDSHGSLEPDDEVMPYSDDETDDELDASSDGEAEEPPPGVPQPSGEARPSGEPLKTY